MSLFGMDFSVPGLGGLFGSGTPAMDVPSASGMGMNFTPGLAAAATDPSLLSRIGSAAGWPFRNDPGSTGVQAPPRAEGMGLDYTPGLNAAPPAYGGMFGGGPMTWKQKLGMLGTAGIVGGAGAMAKPSPPPAPGGIGARPIDVQSLMSLIRARQQAATGMPGTASPMGMPQNLPTMNFRRPY